MIKTYTVKIEGEESFRKLCKFMIDNSILFPSGQSMIFDYRYSNYDNKYPYIDFTYGFKELLPEKKILNFTQRRTRAEYECYSVDEFIEFYNNTFNINPKCNRGLDGYEAYTGDGYCYCK